MTSWPNVPPANDYETIAEAVRAAYLAEVLPSNEDTEMELPPPFPPITIPVPPEFSRRTQWLFGDGNLSDNRGWNRITVWCSGGREVPIGRSQDGVENITASRLVTMNFRLWAEDQTVGDWRMRALYNAIVKACGDSDFDRSPVREKWQGFKGKTVSGWQITLSFDVRLVVYESDTYNAERVVNTLSFLPPKDLTVPVESLAIEVVADGEAFGPIQVEPVETED